MYYCYIRQSIGQLKNGLDSVVACGFERLDGGLFITFDVVHHHLYRIGRDVGGVVFILALALGRLRLLLRYLCAMG